MADPDHKNDSTGGAILFYDFEKAFDRVSWEYMPSHSRGWHSFNTRTNNHAQPQLKTARAQSWDRRRERSSREGHDGPQPDNSGLTTPHQQRFTTTTNGRDPSPPPCYAQKPSLVRRPTENRVGGFGQDAVEV